LPRQTNAIGPLASLLFTPKNLRLVLNNDSASHANPVRMEFSDGTSQTADKGRTMSLARTLSTVVAAAISTAACGGDSAHAAAITYRCTNPKSGMTWEVKVDYDRSIADSFPAKITGSQIAWHDTLHGGYYFLDRASGALTFQNASSTGGYVTHQTCHAD